MKIGNINKKIFTGAAGLALCTILLTGCDDNFKYEEQEDGTIVPSGNISYENLASCNVIEIKVIDKNMLYLVRKEAEKDNNYTYYDLFTDLKIYSSNDNNDRMSVINEYRLGDYLVNLNELKKNYSDKDLNRILNEIASEYSFAENKELNK